MKGALAAFVIVLCATSLAAQSVLIGPVHGVWCNRQVLALSDEVLGDGEAFYSLDGRDPEMSGFAYDGPVLLDKAGDVTLRVAVVRRSGKVEQYAIDYTVVSDVTLPPDALEALPLRSGIIDCKSGEVITIPQSLSYSIGGGELSFEQWRTISCRADCILQHLVPIVFRDEAGHSWAFLLRVSPSTVDGDAVAAVPFSVDDWSKITFNDNKRIYRIDGGMWRPCSRKGENIAIDRKTKHVLSWQSVNYKAGNPITTFVLPPKPVLATTVGQAGDVAFRVCATGADGGDTADYAIGTMSQGQLSLRKSAALDTFSGDEISGTFRVPVYYKGVYQGTLDLSYDIDRRKPAAPVISSTVPMRSDGRPALTRSDVDVTVTGESGTVLFVAVDGKSYEADSGNASVKKLHFTAGMSEADDSPHYVSAYSVDERGNVSGIAQYAVTIDRVHYVVDATAGSGGGNDNGEAFSTIEECLQYAVNVTDRAHITVRGTVHTRGGRIVIPIDCTIVGEAGDARIAVGERDDFTVRGVQVTMQGLLVERGGEAVAEGRPLINVADGVLVINDCEVFSAFGQSGSVIQTNGGALVIQNSGVTGAARLFNAVVTAANTNVRVASSRLTASGSEAVCLTALGGETTVAQSACRVNAERAHAVELFGTKSCLTGNTFEASLTGVTDGQSVYCDANNEMVEMSGNTEQGW